MGGRFGRIVRAIPIVGDVVRIFDNAAPRSGGPGLGGASEVILQQQSNADATVRALQRQLAEQERAAQAERERLEREARTANEEQRRRLETEFNNFRQQEQEARERLQRDLQEAQARARERVLQEQKDQKKAITSERLIEEARTRLGIDMSKYNWVISGVAGSGKSTFINTILGLRPTEKGAARVGITETTLEAKEYAPPETRHLRIWDVPGCGTPRNPIFHENPELHYYRRYAIYAFDAVLVLYSERPSDDALYLVRTCLDAGQPVALVRTKADIAAEDAIENGTATAEDADAYVRRVFDDEAASSFRDLYPRVNKFIVSMRQFSRGTVRFDEVKLIQFLRNSALLRQQQAPAAN